MINSAPNKIKFIIFLMLTLTSTIATLSFISTAKAEVKIILIAPTSGYIGTSVTLTANISTFDGRYEILFDGAQLLSGNATGNSVRALIVIPPAPAGSHKLTIVDITSGENDTATFEVLTLYLLKISPLELPAQQRQEGDSAEILVNITGGKQNEYYVANITVQAPDNASYKKWFGFRTTELGSGNITIKYPENFTSATTKYVGTYKVFFNGTLAITSFNIGLSNSTEYHRFQIVDIKAIGYMPKENVTLKITGKSIQHSQNLTADDIGVIHYINWTVPANATVGEIYTINITSISNSPTIKNPPDVQSFKVPGFDVNITARNLAKETVPQVTIQIFEHETPVVNTTSNSKGLATLKLEIGNYTARAFLKNKQVGLQWINVTKSASFDFYCNLTNLKILVIAVVDENEIYVPEIKIFLSPENRSETTNITGAAVFHSLLPNMTYRLNVSRYEVQFNSTILQSLFENENPVAWFNLTIKCPNYTLQVNVTNPNANNQPINNALVKIQEIMGGLCFEKTTSDGTAIFNTPLGKYIVEVYVSGIKLNETFVNLNMSFVNVFLSCKFYGLNIKVQVVDYFGQPIPNVNVTLSLDGLQKWNRTESDGIAMFPKAIGGNLTVSVYLPGQSQPYLISSLYVDSSKTIQIKIERYTVLAGFLVETSHLVTSIIIAISVIVILSLEFYRRRRLKLKTGKSES